MKIRTIIASMLAIAALAGCTKENGGKIEPGAKDVNVAYLSVKIATQQQSRSSGENPGTDESAIKTLYLVSFTDEGHVVVIPGTSNYYTEILNASASPEPVKVSASGTRLLVIVNPGDKLKAAITGIGSMSTFASVNEAIKEAAKSELIDNPAKTKGFAMINSGDETGKIEGDKISDPLINISTYIKKVADYADEQAAKDAADLARVPVKVERIASKLDFTVKDNPTVNPTGATFAFINWTLDAVNSTFYPFAEKTIIGVGHTTGFYTNNFYTRDPNYSGTGANDGILYAKVNPTTYEPELLTDYGWLNKTDSIYCVENTMDAPDQLFENATRLVVKGTYYPPKHVTRTSDWFHFGGYDYLNLDSLQKAYGLTQPNSPLRNACDRFYDDVYR